MVKKYLYLFIVFFLVFLLNFFGVISFKFPDIKFENGNTKNYKFYLTGIDILTGNLYIIPFDSFANFKSSVYKTKEILYLQTYDFTEKRVKKIFKGLLDNNVEIKLIMENKKYKQYKNTFDDIKNYFSGYDNFQVKSDDNMGTEYIHSKIMLSDNEFWVQSANLTHSSLFQNREHFFVSDNSGVYYSLKHIFEKDWEGQKILFSDIDNNLLVCNIDCRIKIETLLKSAKKSIIIQTQYITDAKIRNILGNKVLSGIDLKILLAKTDNNDININYFGPKIARFLAKPYNHTKMILIDGKILLIGSMNLSENSLDNNREIGVLTKDDVVINKFLEQFWKDWNNSIY